MASRKQLKNAILWAYPEERKARIGLIVSFVPLIVALMASVVYGINIPNNGNFVMSKNVGADIFTAIVSFASPIFVYGSYLLIRDLNRDIGSETLNELTCFRVSVNVFIVLSIAFASMYLTHNLESEKLIYKFLSVGFSCTFILFHLEVHTYLLIKLNKKLIINRNVVLELIDINENLRAPMKTNTLDGIIDLINFTNSHLIDITYAPAIRNIFMKFQNLYLYTMERGKCNTTFLHHNETAYGDNPIVEKSYYITDGANLLSLKKLILTYASVTSELLRTGLAKDTFEKHKYDSGSTYFQDIEKGLNPSRFSSIINPLNSAANKHFLIVAKERQEYFDELSGERKRQDSYNLKIKNLASEQQLSRNIAKVSQMLSNPESVNEQAEPLNDSGDEETAYFEKI